MNDIKLVYQNSGSWWCVGIYSAGADEEAIEAQYNSFWNHGATSTEPKKATDSLWYFWTTPKLFRKALESAELFKLLNEGEESNCFKGCEGGAMPYAKELAKAKIAEMEKKDSSMRYGRQGHVYTLGEVYTNDEKSFTSGRNAGE